MEPYQERVIEEKKALDEKIKKLRDFAGTGPFLKLSPAHQTLLIQQEATMGNYSNILAARVKLFEKEAAEQEDEPGNIPG